MAGITVLRKKRTRILDDMHKARKLTDAQHKAGVQLGNLYELQFTSPERNGIFVDVAPDWSAIVVNQLQRVWDYEGLMGVVPRRYRLVVAHVCCEDRALRDGVTRNGRETTDAEETLRRGLDALVKLLGY